MTANNRTIGAILAMASILIFQAMPAPALEAQTGEIAVAAASDLTFVFDEVGARFRQETGNSIKLSFGSSGNFFSQITNGAPYDMFFSADAAYPKKLAAAGLAEPGSIYVYAIGKLVIWAPSKSNLDINQGLKVLLDPDIEKIAIADPDHAPYGAAAVAAMRRNGIYDQVKRKLVLGENIAQTAQFVQSGNAQVGMIALSLAIAPAMRNTGRYFDVPPADYPPIIQTAVILKASRNKNICRQFLKFLTEPPTVALMQQYGFGPPRSESASAQSNSVGAN